MVSHDDPNNPYTNPYLDSDLAMTIGRNKENRKQINAFQLQERPIETKNDTMNSEETT